MATLMGLQVALATHLLSRIHVEALEVIAPCKQSPVVISQVQSAEASGMARYKRKMFVHDWSAFATFAKCLLGQMKRRRTKPSSPSCAPRREEGPRYVQETPSAVVDAGRPWRNPLTAVNFVAINLTENVTATAPQ